MHSMAFQKFSKILLKKDSFMIFWHWVETWLVNLYACGLGTCEDWWDASLYDCIWLNYSTSITNPRTAVSWSYWICKMSCSSEIKQDFANQGMVSLTCEVGFELANKAILAQCMQQHLGWTFSNILPLSIIFSSELIVEVLYLIAGRWDVAFLGDIVV